MPKVNFGASREAAEKSGALSSGDRFKIKEGPNRVRLMSEFLPHTSYFKASPQAVGQRRFQWIGYILDRVDGQVKTFFMPHTIHKFIEDLQQDSDWSFDEVPLPYDVTINAKNAGTKEVEYSVTPSPKRVPATPAELAALAEKKPIAEVQKTIYDKQNIEDTTRAMESAFDPDELPA